VFSSLVLFCLCHCVLLLLTLQHGIFCVYSSRVVPVAAVLCRFSRCLLLLCVAAYSPLHCHYVLFCCCPLLNTCHCLVFLHSLLPCSFLSSPFPLPPPMPLPHVTAFDLVVPLRYEFHVVPVTCNSAVTCVSLFRHSPTALALGGHAVPGGCLPTCWPQPWLGARLVPIYSPLFYSCAFVCGQCPPSFCLAAAACGRNALVTF
jgi:hypothetical protein